MDSSQDIIDLIKQVLLDEGIRAVTFVSVLQEGKQAALSFLATEKPAVCVYSISLPYGESWAIFQEIRGQYQACHYVVTTTNVRGLQGFVGPTDAIELIGKPFDLEELLQAVRHALPAGEAVG